MCLLLTGNLYLAEQADVKQQILPFNNNRMLINQGKESIEPFNHVTLVVSRPAGGDDQSTLITFTNTLHYGKCRLL